VKNLKEVARTTNDYTILYVEDDIESAKIIIEYLSSLFREVVFAENGEQGLGLYKQMNFDIVLTDINMPVMGGLDMSAEIKKINNSQSIIIISAYSDIKLFISSIQLSIDGYIIKPINFDDMNNLLYKVGKKIENFRQNEKNEKELKKFVEKMSQKNTELAQYREILDNVAVVSITDKNGVITYVNDYFCEVSGYFKEELIGSNHNILSHKDTPKNIYKNLWETIQNGNVWTGTLKNRTKEGETYFGKTIIMPIYDDDHEKINEYISVKFLTTQEEKEKRNFKKKVINNYQELRKNDYELNKKNKYLEKTIEKLNLEELHKNTTISQISEKNKKLLSQITFYESEARKKDLKFIKSFEATRATLVKTTDLYKKTLVKNESIQEENTFIKKDNRLKNIEIEKLNERISKQSSMIAQLEKS